MAKVQKNSEGRMVLVTIGALLGIFVAIGMCVQAYWIWYIAQLIKDGGFTHPDVAALTGNTIQNAIILWAVAIFARILIAFGNDK